MGISAQLARSGGKKAIGVIASFAFAMPGSPKRIDPQRLDQLKAGWDDAIAMNASYNLLRIKPLPDPTAQLTQAFFTEMIMQPNFIPERRRELRIRAGLREHDRKAGALCEVKHKFHIVCTSGFTSYSYNEMSLKTIPILLHAGAKVSFRSGGWSVHR